MLCDTQIFKLLCCKIFFILIIWADGITNDKFYLLDPQQIYIVAEG